MDSLTWKIERREVGSLKNWEQNPRTISKSAFEKLKSRIIARGFHDVIKIDIDGTIMSGNQRKNALLELDIKEVDCIVPNRALTEQERQAVALESNRNDGEWDWDMLTGFDMGILSDVGFSAKELAANFKLDVKDDDFDVDAELKKETKAKLGDIYHLGRHRIICGDATDKNAVLKLMDGNKAGMCFTDPPYNVDYTGGMGTHEQNKRTGILNDKMSKDSFYQFLLKVNQNIMEVVGGGVLYMHELERNR